MLLTREINTGLFSIGPESPCYVIAEIGSNHNGSFDLAVELIEKASEAGVNAVKFQTFKASQHYSKRTPSIGMYKQNIYELIESLEIDRTWHHKLAQICKKNGLDFLDSPCDSDAIDLAVSVDMKLLKIGSFDMVDVRHVRNIAKTKRGIIFSAGMANLSEIQSAINICHEEGNRNIVVLQCTSLYPAPAHLSNLKAMHTMANMFNVMTGYSDHTLGDHVACAAVALGARVIEKHYTLNRKMDGPDHPFGIEPHELKIMMEKIREIELSIGDGEKNGPRMEEMELFQKARRSIVASRDIEPGEIVKEEDLVIKRPGTGLHPSMLAHVVGRIVRFKILEDEPLTWDKL